MVQYILLHTDWSKLVQHDALELLHEHILRETEELRSLTFLISFVIRKERLLELKHVFLGVRSIKHFGENDYVGTIGGSFLTY
jgi:uncharacterized protein YydD (DUF2326 family)